MIEIGLPNEKRYSVHKDVADRIRELEKENKWFLEGLIEIHDWSCDELIRKIAEKYMGWHKHITTVVLEGDDG